MTPIVTWQGRDGQQCREPAANTQRAEERARDLREFLLRPELRESVRVEPDREQGHLRFMARKKEDSDQ